MGRRLTHPLNTSLSGWILVTLVQVGARAQLRVTRYLCMSPPAIGVAICSPDRTSKESIMPIPIQKWPCSGIAGLKVTNKVPTLVSYRAGDLRVRSWGFTCLSRGNPSPNMTVCRLFKFLLDEKYLEKVNEGKSKDEQESIENVRKWFTDFLSELHNHIVAHLEDPPWFVDWGSTKVEYIFSLPTSWQDNDELIEELKKIVKQAGFGSEENCSVTIGLTEGVASAVYTAKSVNHNFNVSYMYFFTIIPLG
jgi:hypothetical protein